MRTFHPFIHRFLKHIFPHLTELDINYLLRVGHFSREDVETQLYISGFGGDAHFMTRPAYILRFSTETMERFEIPGKIELPHPPDDGPIAMYTKERIEGEDGWRKYSDSFRTQNKTNAH